MAAASVITCAYTSRTNTLCRVHKPSSSSSFPHPSHHTSSVSVHSPSPLFRRLLPSPLFQTLTVAASKKTGTYGDKSKSEEEYEEVEEEDLPWIQEKALDLVDFTGSVTQAVPGPRVGSSSFPWLLTLPIAYLGVTFVIALVKTVNKFRSPKEMRHQLVNKNATLCTSIDALFDKGSDNVNYSALKDLMQNVRYSTGFEMGEILRKYIRYALNEKPFDLNLVANLIHLRKASMLDDSQVAEIINNISSRIVRDKGPVVMDMSGYSEKVFKRKLAVQALFGKIYYLSELPEFCSRDSSLRVKEVFGVTDEDAEKLRLHTMSEAGDVESLEKLMGESSSEGASSNDSSSAE